MSSISKYVYIDKLGDVINEYKKSVDVRSRTYSTLV